jgi:hypothetical protein
VLEGGAYKKYASVIMMCISNSEAPILVCDAVNLHFCVAIIHYSDGFAHLQVHCSITTTVLAILSMTNVLHFAVGSRQSLALAKSTQDLYRRSFSMQSSMAR